MPRAQGICEINHNPDDLTISKHNGSDIQRVEGLPAGLLQQGRARTVRRPAWHMPCIPKLEDWDLGLYGHLLPGEQCLSTCNTLRCTVETEQRMKITTSPVQHPLGSAERGLTRGHCWSPAAGRCAQCQLHDGPGDPASPRSDGTPGLQRLHAP